MPEVQEQEPEFVHAIQGPRELLHIAMYEILKEPVWWSVPENKAIGIGLKATKAGLLHERIRAEFRALRVERGLPEVYGG